MRKFVSIIIIVCHLLMMTIPGLSAQSLGEMLVTKVKNTALVGNMGRHQGISRNSIFLIVKKGPGGQRVVGKAKVLLVEENVSGLKVIELEPATHVEPGDLLIPAPSSDSQEKKLFSKRQEMDKGALTSAQKTDYHQKGKETAQQEYSGNGATTGGVLAGVSSGLIGWGIGYLIVANKSVEVPSRHIDNLEPQQKMEFTAGYKDYVEKKRKISFTAGAGIGTLLAIMIVVSASWR